LRFSFGRPTTGYDIDAAVDRLAPVLARFGAAAKATCR
jgi:cysteine sulfinate desulfinase/cysteine desulfurase-like protein